jgi:hypothetical protein
MVETNDGRGGPGPGNAEVANIRTSSRFPTWGDLWSDPTCLFRRWEAGLAWWRSRLIVRIPVVASARGGLPGRWEMKGF